MYFITTKRMLEVCFSAHPNIQYRTVFLFYAQHIVASNACGYPFRHKLLVEGSAPKPL